MTPGSAKLVGAAVVAGLIAVPVHAQTPSKTSHWGVLVSVAPSWYLPAQITDSVAKDGGGLVVVGSQFQIGIVRGRTMSGDWGVTFVRQPVKNGSTGFDSDTECGFTNGPITGGCFNTSGGAITQGVKMTGVEVHKYIPFVLIKRRFQIGLNFAGGIAKLSGTLQKTSSDITNVVFNPKNNQKTAILTTTVTTEAVTEELPSKVPIGRLTIVGAAILNRTMKVRWEGGMVFPGASFSTIAITYLFGAR